MAAGSRLLPHPANVTPTAAIALFCAATLASKRLAILTPIAILLLSDLAMQLAYRAGWREFPGFHDGQWVVYACSLVPVAIGFALRHRRSAIGVTSGSLAGSVVFFLATNFAYFYGEDSIYPRTWAGIWTCYEMALPFFGRSLIGDLGYAWLLFGSLALAESRFPALRRVQPEPKAA